MYHYNISVKLSQKSLEECVTISDKSRRREGFLPEQGAEGAGEDLFAKFPSRVICLLCIVLGIFYLGLLRCRLLIT